MLWKKKKACIKFALILLQEEESLKRRQSAAKDAVAGTAPPLLEQLLERYSQLIGF